MATENTPGATPENIPGAAPENIPGATPENTPETTVAEGPLHIDLQAIVRARLSPAKRRFVPRALVRAVERLVRQEELNGILSRTYPAEGTAFARAALADLDIRISTEGLENVPAEGRFIFASNHPLGGLDGIALIAVLGEIYGDERLRFPVNDLLMNVRPLKNVFMSVNKLGKQARTNSRLLNEAFASADKQMLIFPAGLVSRKGKKGRIADLEWQKSFITKAIENRRDIIPVTFTGHNSSRFYNAARWRKRLHIGVNLEQALLPGEVCKARGSEFKIIFHKSIAWQKLRDSGRRPQELAQAIREIVHKPLERD